MAVVVPEADGTVEDDEDDDVVDVPDAEVDEPVDGDAGVELVDVGASRPEGWGGLVTRGGAVTTDGGTGRREASQ